MKRRTFVIGGSAATFWAANPLAMAQTMGGMNMDDMNMGGGSSEAGKRVINLPTGAPLPEMKILANETKETGLFKAIVEAGPSTVEFAPGIKSRVLTYNKQLPGPLISVVEGDKVTVAFRNRIPDQDSTIHWHGLPVPPEQDGNPADAVASLAERVYEFTVPDGSAGSYWYHPHPHGRTAEQVYRGLAGAFIVRAKDDPLPKTLGDTTLFINSFSLNDDGSLPESTPADLMNGREGDHVLVNGAKEPVLKVAPGSSRRFRIFNATSARFLRLSLEGHKMTLVGSDGGLLAEPQPGLDELLLAPAERIEIVVDFNAKPGRFALVSAPYERGWMGHDKPEVKTISLMTFNLTGSPGAKIELPKTLRAIAALPEAKSKQRVEIGETMGMGNGMMTMGFLLDGKTYKHGRIDKTAKLDDVELWEIVNVADMDHPFHIHGGQFQVVERVFDGKVTAEPFLAWKDTVNIKAGETVRLKMMQAHAGERLYHCHILEHEDAGMMGILKVG